MLYKTIFKRLLDFIVSLLLLLVFLPLLVLVMCLLFIQNKGKPFFFQERPGYLQRPFKIIKFKTMTDAKDASGQLLPDFKRLTKLGSVIRKLSLDELPQLLNVLKGDMSLVGPRPLLFKYIPLFSEEQNRRHEVKPGITGWAQVNGRNSISWTRKFELDVYYVDHVSFLLDVKILWLTFLKVIQREGVNQSDDRPMQPFNGLN
ncbi:MAG: sugar transferase [Flavobacterium sp.]|nr:sugar transferase [Flavobacterium sp.]